MLDKIIVGVDGLEGGRDAIALGARLAALAGGRMVLVNAYPGDPRPFHGDSVSYDRAMQDEAEALLSGERERAGVEADLAPRGATSPAHALQEMVEPGDGAVIVIGASRRSTVGRALAGDTIRAALSGAPCAVAVASKGYAAADRPFKRIGVGWDESPESERALDAAAALARDAGATIDVLDVVEEPAAPAFGWPQGFDFDKIADTVESAAAGAVAEATARLGVAVDHEVRVGVPGRELVALSRRCDLLVVGSRGFGPARRVILGSTSDYLVHHAQCPVVVLARGAAGTTDGHDTAAAGAATSG